MKHVLTIFLILSGLMSSSQGVVVSHVQNAQGYSQNIEYDFLDKADVGGNEEIDNSASGLVYFLAFGFMFILIFIGVGIALTSVLLFIIFKFISAGIISAAMVIGLNRKAFAKRFKKILFLTTTISGIVIGTIGFVIVNLITRWWTVQIALLTGSISGLFAGFIFGLIVYKIIVKFKKYIKAKFNIQ